MKKKPLLIVISAPSGTGKTVLCNMLLKEFPEISYSISCTTREPRGKEKNNIDYYFISDDEFKNNIQKDLFLEYADVHNHKYGTLKSEVIDKINSGNSVIMDIDVQGAKQIREKSSSIPLLKKSYIDIFICPPSINELERRLKNRGEDSEEVINLRLRNAEKEMAEKEKYKYIVINDQLEKAYSELRDIYIKESLV